MKANIRLPKTRLLTANLLLFLFFFIHQSCTKLDTGSNRLSQTPAEKFFTIPAGTNPQIRSVIDNLKKQNSLTGFINTLAQQEGYAVWDKAIIKRIANRTGGLLTAEDSVAYIPLVLENTAHVNSFLYVRLNGNMQIRLMRGRDYSMHGFDSTKASNAQNFTMQIMLLENEVFGHTKFKINDNRLFASGNTRHFQQTEVELKESPSANASLAGRFVLGMAYVTYVGCGGSVPPCTASYCDHCNGCIIGRWEETMQWIDDYDDFGNPTGGGDPNGGGSGIPGGGPGGTGQCTIVINGEMPPGCGGSGNLNPVTVIGGNEPTNQDCDPYVSTIVNDAEFNQKLNILRNGDFAQQKERGYKAFAINSPYYTALEGDLNDPEIKINYDPVVKFQGLMHTHYAGLAPMFSPADVVSMAETFLTNNAITPQHLFYTMTGVDVLGSKYNYMMLVTDTAKFRIFANQIAGTKELSIQFKKTYDDKFRTGDNTRANEIGFLSMMKKFGNNNGFQLYRGDGSAANVTWERLNLIGSSMATPGTPGALDVQPNNCN